MSVNVEIPQYKKGDLIRFSIEAEVTHVLQSDTQPGRINYILNNGFVLLARERDKGTVTRIGLEGRSIELRAAYLEFKEAVFEALHLEQIVDTLAKIINKGDR